MHIVLGTKAQLVKMAPVMAECVWQEISCNFIFASQHRETIDDRMAWYQLESGCCRLTQLLIPGRRHSENRVRISRPSPIARFPLSESSGR
jgi:hypothetical protein